MKLSITKPEKDEMMITALLTGLFLVIKIWNRYTY